jgi:glycerophosphoryl diester phosphodiesterase
VEGYDENDERCLMLVEALNRQCVKGITVRDDIACLREHYIKNERISVREVFDPAIWSSKSYVVEPKKAGGKYIGLGVARDTLFTDYGIPEIDRGFLIRLWTEIADCLEKRGYEWKIFTNGLDKDEAFARDVLDAIGHGEKVKAPFDAKELVDEIAAMDGMIACRMHSNIIAYALGIPSVGLVWNEKMTFWGQKCGYPERFIPSDRLSAEYITGTLEKAFAEKTKKPSWMKRMGIYRQLRRFIKKECKERQKETPKLDIKKHLVAPALGGSDFKYKNLNSLPQLEKAVERGYRYLELDVRMTSDQKLVCVNGWNAGTAAALGDERAKQEMLFSDFMEDKYYGHFPTCSFEQAAKAFAVLPEEEKITLILDVGKPRTASADLFYEQLVGILKEQGIKPQSVRIRLQRERDVKSFKSFGYNCPIIYYIEQGDAEKEEAVIAFCKKKKIRMVSMTEKTWTPELQQKLNEEGIKTLVLTYKRAGDVIRALNEGAELVASHYYDVAYIKSMML